MLGFCSSMHVSTSVSSPATRTSHITQYSKWSKLESMALRYWYRLIPVCSPQTCRSLILRDMCPWLKITMSGDVPAKSPTVSYLPFYL